MIMANVNIEDDKRDIAEREKHGHRLSGSSYVSKQNSNLYNKTHGTSFHDDAALKRYEENENRVKTLTRRMRKL